MSIILAAAGKKGAEEWIDIPFENQNWDDNAIPDGVWAGEQTDLRLPWLYSGTSQTQGGLLAGSAVFTPPPYAISGDNIYILYGEPNRTFHSIASPYYLEEGRTYRFSVWSCRRIDLFVDDKTFFLEILVNDLLVATSDECIPTRTEWNQFFAEYTAVSDDTGKQVKVMINSRNGSHTGENQVCFDSAKFEYK